MKARSFAVIAFACLGPASMAAVYTYADWLSSPGPLSAHGTITIGSEVIDVDYAGRLSFVQLSGGTNYWVPNTPYLSSTVENAPITPDILAVDVAGSHSLTFSKPVTNPIMPLVSVGRPALPVTYTFGQDFIILSQAPGYFGGTNTSFVKNGLSLTGNEAHGTIQFLGTFTEITWTTAPSEFWHGHTIGLANPAVPEPFTLVLAGGTLGLAAIRRRKR